MKKFSSLFELSISPENEALIPLIAEEFGWYPSMSMTPEQVIVQHFELFYQEGVKNRIEARLMRLKGEAGKAEVEVIMEQYRNAVITSSGFQDL